MVIWLLWKELLCFSRKLTFIVYLFFFSAIVLQTPTARTLSSDLVNDNFILHIHIVWKIRIEVQQIIFLHYFNFRKKKAKDYCFLLKTRKTKEVSINIS